VLGTISSDSGEVLRQGGLQPAAASAERGNRTAASLSRNRNERQVFFILTSLEPSIQIEIEHAVKTQDAIKSLAALSQETRLGIYRLLVQQGPEGLSVGAIAATMDVNGATLSFHLKELGNANLVTARQDGRFVFYTANYDTMNGLLAYLTDNCCQGQACLVECKPTRQPRRKRA